MPRLRVLGGELEAGLGQADGERRDGDPAVVQGLEELAEAPAARAQQVLLRHPAAGEGQAVGVGRVPAELVVGRLDGEARGAGRHQDRADLGAAVLAGAGAGGDGDDRGDVGARVGDERLGAVDDPLAGGLVEPGAGAGGAGVRAGVGLGQAERRERAAGDQVGQPALLLLLGAEAEDRVDAQADAGAQGDADALVDPAELLDGHAEAGEGVLVQPGAAVLLRGHQAEQPEVAHLRHELHREVVVAVPLLDVRADLVLGELPDGGAEVLVLLAQLELAVVLAGGRRPGIARRWTPRSCLTLTSRSSTMAGW